MIRNPDKWIRKAISDAINGMIVSGNTIPCFDVNVAGNTQPMFFVEMTTQTKIEDKFNKCKSRWDCTMLLDCITRYQSTGNIGSRVLVNDIEDEVMQQLDNLVLENGFRVFNQTVESSTSMDMHDDTEITFRQLIRYRLIVDDTN
jgi:hypothetical protein